MTSQGACQGLLYSLLSHLSVPKVMDVDLSASSSVVKQGEVLTVNCTVRDVDMVFFRWDFPRRQVPVALSTPVYLSSDLT